MTEEPCRMCETPTEGYVRVQRHNLSAGYAPMCSRMCAHMFKTTILMAIGDGLFKDTPIERYEYIQKDRALFAIPSHTPPFKKGLKDVDRDDT